MNRYQKAIRVLHLEAAAAEMRRRAAVVREELAQEAEAELDREGTAPTWRLPDIGTVTLPVSRETVYVADEAALLGFAKERFPDEVETLERIRPAFLPVLIGLMDHDGGRVYDGEGTIIPGLAVRAGGVPGSLSFRPNTDAREGAALVAAKLVDDLEGVLDGPIIIAEAP